MRGSHGLRLGILLGALVVIVSMSGLEASGYGRFEIGVGVPISTSFTFSSFSYGLDLYGRMLLGMLAWEIAFQTYPSFDTLYLRNTLYTLGGLFLSLGHVTNLLPHFGSTYFTLGAGIMLGQVYVFRLAVNLAASVSGGFYPFLEFRLQFGLDP